MAQQPFEIGLVMAGAISAGAYTAGALDFLIEALDAWEDAKDRRADDAPPHDVQIKVVAGASAGSMCAAIAGAALGYAHTPVHAGNHTSASNPFFQSWVKDIDISALLSTADIDRGQPLRSLLNSEKLPIIVNTVLNMGGTKRTRRCIADPLAIRLSVGNLKGIPYRIGMAGHPGAGHAMALHGDNFSFALSDTQNPVCAADWTKLPRPNSAATAAWAKFGTAALASGAFPLFLQPRTLRHATHSGLGAREFLLPGDGTSHPQHGASRPITILPAWPTPQPPDPYACLNVDGGIINNEPLELAREYLAGVAGRNPRDGNTASRAVLMIDPFIDDVSPGPETDLMPLKVILPLTVAWKNQCRFKPIDLALAHAENVYSRFLIAPSRGSSAPGQHPCASGGLGGFLGFFHEEFRIHDYLLGRRNCQFFLQQHFSLPETNPLFGSWTTGQRQAHAIPDPKAGTHLPIIPVMGSAATPQPLPDWPAGKLQGETLLDPITARAQAVFDAMVGDLKWMPRLYVRLGWNLGGRKALVDAAIEAVDGALAAQKL